MMRRSSGAELDKAVLEHRVTLVHGLPRVGRSKTVKRWSEERDDVEILHGRPRPPGTKPVRLFDHFELTEVAAFVTLFRTLERAGHDVRFVVVPVDLLTLRQLQEILTGSVNLLTIDPLQPDEFIAERVISFEATGPTGEALAMSGPTNAAASDPDLHWLRGGLPESLDAGTDQASLAWRRQLIDSLLVRNYASWDITAATKLSDILLWVANLNGAELDETGCPIAKRGELLSALHVFDRLGLTRRLPNFPAGTSAGLDKKPKLFIRDSGILHAMLGIVTTAQLRKHSAIGESWEAYALDALITAADGRCTPQFYREKLSGEEGADEIDLVLDFRQFNDRLVAIECKTNPSKEARAGFHRGMQTIEATDGFVVHSGSTAQLSGRVDRLDLTSAIQRVVRLSESRTE